MGPDGHGTLTAYFDQSSGEAVPSGHYVYRTKDWGKTWSKPKLERDALYRAPSVDTIDGSGVREFIRQYFPNADQNLPPSTQPAEEENEE